MKKYLTLGAIFLILFLISTLSWDITLSGRYRPNRALIRAIKELEHPLQVDWYRSSGAGLEGEISLFFRGLSRRSNVQFYSHESSAENLDTQGFQAYSYLGGTHYSGVVIRYLDQEMILPQVLEPPLLEERLLAWLGYLTGENKPAIALVTGDWTQPLEERSSAMVEYLRAYGEPRLVNNLQDLEEEQMIILQGHWDLTVLDIAILEEFRSRGGSLLILASPFRADPQEADQVEPSLPSPFMAWLQEQGLALENQMVLDPMQALSLGDGSRYPAWFTPNIQGGAPLLQALWASPVTVDTSRYEILWQWTSSSRASALVPYSLSPMELQPAQNLAALTNSYTVGVVAQDHQGMIALFGSSWMFSDMVVESMVQENLEGLNGIVLAMTGQEELLTFRQSWSSIPREFYPWLLLALLPAFPLAYLVVRKRRRNP